MNSSWYTGPNSQQEKRSDCSKPVCTGITIHCEQVGRLSWQGKECMAVCSGCITSAETVLLQAESANDFREALKFAAASGGSKVGQCRLTLSNPC